MPLHTRSRHPRSRSSRSITKKCKLSPSKLRLICNGTSHVLESFEQEFEKTFTHNLKKENANVQKSLIKIFKTPFAPSKITPQNDYYTYINYNWIHKQTKELAKINKFYVQMDNFRITQEKVYYELIEIVKEYIKNNDTAKSRAIKNLYECMLHLDDKEAEDQVLLTQSVIEKAIDTDVDNNNLYWLLAQINQNEVLSWGCPVLWTVAKDQKRSTMYKSTISQPQLTIYDYTLYIDDETADDEVKRYRRKLKSKYFQYIDEMFDACLGKGHGLKASDVWDVEYELLTAMGCDSVKNESKEYYNVVTKEDALSKYGFDWARLATEIGYDKVPSTFICTNLSYLKCIMAILTKDGAWKTPKWKTYFMYIIFRQIH